MCIFLCGEKESDRRLPEVRDLCAKYRGIDICRGPIPVAPSVHFFMGGLAVRPDHETNIRNLYAVGECASMYHGANRLGRNSLLAAIYSGRIAAKAVSEKRQNLPLPKPEDFSAYIEKETAHLENIEPLRKFPVICDLVSDRSVIQENLKKTDIYIEAWHPSKKEDHVHQYTVAKCLKCGLCLEICPNYGSGESFYGAAFANDCYLINARNRTKSGEMKKVYREHFGNGYSKALSCMNVCPMGIQTIASIAKLQRNKF